MMHVKRENLKGNDYFQFIGYKVTVIIKIKIHFPNYLRLFQVAIGTYI